MREKYESFCSCGRSMRFGWVFPWTVLRALSPYLEKKERASGPGSDNVVGTGASLSGRLKVVLDGPFRVVDLPYVALLLKE